ncbi:MAG: YCF48-related protein [Acidobacteria bacterium]|nr:YCF48-related protein [Acidobacteriota bacterium]
MFNKRNDRGTDFTIHRRVFTPTVVTLIVASIILLPFLFPSSGNSSIRNTELGWKPLKSGVLSRLSSVFFVDNQRGWIVGSLGTLMATEDGGVKWRKITLPGRQQRELIRDVWYLKPEGLPERLCLMGEYGMLNQKGSYNPTLRSFVLINSWLEESWSDGTVARQPYRQPDTIRGRMTVTESGKPQVKDPDDYQEYLRSPDPILLRLVFVNDRIGWACGESGSIQITQDGGMTWTLQYPLSRKLLNDISAVDEMHAWAVGASGTILRTDNGGKQWEERRSGVTEALRSVHFVDRMRGWAVGANGRIISTDDGGHHWKIHQSKTTISLNDVFFLNENEGWIAADLGAILHTTDGGLTWEGERLDTHANLNRLFFISPNCGWVVGTAGQLYKYGQM